MVRTEPEERRYTIGEYEQLPDDELFRDELVRGCVVREPRPGNEHGKVQLNLASELRQHVRRNGLGVVRVETGYALMPSTSTVRGPDVSFIARERIPPEGLPPGFPKIPPDLACEVVSPSNTASEMQEKVDDYFEAGVRQVWIAYPRTRCIAVHLSRAEVRMFRENDELDGGELVPGFSLPVGEIFSDG